MNLKSNIVTLAIAASLAAVPIAGVAGSYGAAAKDDRVSRQARSGNTVWCARLEADIPVSLAEEMDCGGFAKPAVAGDRIHRLDVNERDDGDWKPRPKKPKTEEPGPEDPGPEGPENPGPEGPEDPGPEGPENPGPEGPEDPGPEGPEDPGPEGPEESGERTR